MNNQPNDTQPVEPKPSWFARHKVLSIIGGLFLFLIVIGIATGGEETSKPKADKLAAAPKEPNVEPAKEDKPEPEPTKAEQSQADRFKAFVANNGSATEKAAVKHVTKVQGADEQNDILDAAEIFTDYTGGLMGEGKGPAKLIASAFADWKNSENGLVTVYDKDGEIITNGQF